jgi:NAD(P)H-hydrate epimerase
MKVLTSAEMHEVDRLTIEQGIPGIVLMENAAHRVVEYLAKAHLPLADQRIVVLCGKGNNGGDGFAVARQLLTRFHPKRLDVILAGSEQDLHDEAALNYRMWRFCGGAAQAGITPEMRTATLVIDALLGTGLKGPATGRMLELIREVNGGFPLASVVAVDIPSGMPSDGPMKEGECVRADATVTFTAPKVGQIVGPNYESCGKLIVGEIGSPARLYENTQLHVTDRSEIADLFAPRDRDANKGMYGHALIVAGGPGKTGAAAMAGIAALRAGAGLVTVGSSESVLPVIAGYSPELMTEPIRNFDDIIRFAKNKTVVAMGPGMGTEAATSEVVRRAFAKLPTPLVVDADGLNVLAGSDFRGPGQLRVLTPHPGEMSRLTRIPTHDVQGDRLGRARAFAADRNVCVVLKGDRTVIAFPDGRAWINPTGSPSMATGGTGDVLTGMIAGMIAQFPNDSERAILAAVWLHGRAGEIGAKEIGEKAFIATDVLRFLPEAMRDVSNFERR